MKKVTKETKTNNLKGPVAERKNAEVHVERKALADLSNVQRRSLVHKVPDAAKFVDSWASRTRHSTLSQYLVGKKNTSTAQGVDSHAFNRASGRVSTGTKSNIQKPSTGATSSIQNPNTQDCKAAKDRFTAKSTTQVARKPFPSTGATSTIQNPKTQVCKAVRERSTSKSTIQVVRKSCPVSGQASYGHKRNCKENAESADIDKRVNGFHVNRLNTRVGGNVISRASDAKNKLLKDRVSDVSLPQGSRSQSNLDTRVRLRRSVKSILRTGVTASKGGRPTNSRCKATLDKSKPTILSKREIKGTFLHKSIESIDHVKAAEEEVTRANKNVNPKISEVKAVRRSDRRKSYTSMLLSGSKLLEKSSAKKPKLSSIDDQANPLEVAEYVDEIYLYYWAMEAQSTIVANYMTNQTEITPQMRGVVVNWLIEVHHKFDLMPETLYLTVSILDRYLFLVTISKSQMQLVGLTALLLASKYEDFWHPRVKDLVSISAESYTRDQVLQMEKDILRKLRFRFNLPTAYVFMLQFLKASQSDAKELEYLAFYLIELCLVQYEVLSFKPSMLCAAAIYVARCTLQVTPNWTTLLEHHAHYRESEIRNCSEMILRFQKAAKSGLLKVTYEKYGRPEFGEVAAIKPLKCLPC